MFIPRSLMMRLRALAFALCASFAPTAATLAQEVWYTPGGEAATTPTSTVIGDGPTAYGYEPMPVSAPVETWIGPPGDPSQGQDPGAYFPDSGWDGLPNSEVYPHRSAAWHWQALPNGLIYRSYQAGVHEPRLSIVAFSEADGRKLWDGTLGGRVGLLRYGTAGAINPQGWQVDVEAAAMVRLTLDEIRDFESGDYRVGIPITYGVDNWQYKFGVYHLSSHLGDEFILAHLPGALTDRINYVRDAFVLGASYFPNPAWRLYSEAAYAVNVDGGAEPWEFQFGTEVSRPGPTGPHGTPFWAINGHVREEHDFGGDMSTQLGWLWRGESGQTVRLGVHYFNGKSSQYQTFDDSEEQIGGGMWYDF